MMGENGGGGEIMVNVVLIMVWQLYRGGLLEE